MTAIAIWLNEEVDGHPALDVAADSLVIGNRSTQLINDASKIFPLRVECRVPSANGIFSELSSSCVYGYAFAGSTLLGQNSYLSLAPLVGSFISTEPYSPSLEDVSEYVLRYLRIVYDESKIRGQSASFEVALFGYCPIQRRMEVHHFFPVPGRDTGPEMQRTMHQDLKSGECIYLGSYKDEFWQALSVASHGPSAPGRPISRAPKHVIEDFIADEDYPEIGGDLQLWSARSFGLYPYLLVRPTVVGSPQASFTYLGRRLDGSLLHLGPAYLGMLGRA